MRRSASEVIRNLERRVARLEKQASGYKVETQGREEGGFIPRDNRKNKMKATSLFDRLLGRTFNKQIERALKSEGARNISVSFEPSSRIVGEFINPYSRDNLDEPSSWPLKAEGEGKMFFMLEGSPYEFPFILVHDKIYLGYEDGLDGIAGSVKTTDDGKVSKVVMGRNFLSAIEWANEKFYGKRFARLEKSSGSFDLWDMYTKSTNTPRDLKGFGVSRTIGKMIQNHHTADGSYVNIIPLEQVESERGGFYTLVAAEYHDGERFDPMYLILKGDEQDLGDTFVMNFGYNIGDTKARKYLQQASTMHHKSASTRKYARRIESSLVR